MHFIKSKNIKFINSFALLVCSLSSFTLTLIGHLSCIVVHELSVLFVLVLGGQESRGVLRKISDMLEVIMKRMDTLGNSTDTHRLDELSSALDRYNTDFLVSHIIKTNVPFVD